MGTNTSANNTCDFFSGLPLFEWAIKRNGGPTGPHSPTGVNGPMGPRGVENIYKKKDAYSKARREEVWYEKLKKGRRRLVW